MPHALLCFNPFKGTLSASQANHAAARGLRAAGWSWDSLALADGGPGTLDALRQSVGGRLRQARVQDPLGRTLSAAWLLLPDGTAVLESAQAIGLQHCPPGRRDALKADSFGLGQLLLAVHAAGVRRAWVGLGGSATTDGGQGLARALGWRLLDAQGAPIGPGGGGLRTLSRILAPRKRALAGLRLKVLCDVRNPLAGAEGAAAVYGPQKGAGPRDVRSLDHALRRLARCLPSADPGIPGAGAAGGLGFGLQAFAGATLVPGAETLLQLAGFDRLAAGADCILSGEGRLDRQSLRGKLPWAVAAAARRQGRPCVLFCGQVSLVPRALAQARLRAVQVSPSGPPPLRSSEAAADLRKAVQTWAGLLQTSDPVSDRKN